MHTYIHTYMWMCIGSRFGHGLWVCIAPGVAGGRISIITTVMFGTAVMIVVILSTIITITNSVVIIL